MAAISTTKAIERLNRKLQRAGINQWVAKASGDARGKYLRFAVGGPCLGGCGWSLAEARQKVVQVISRRDERDRELGDQVCSE